MSQQLVRAQRQASIISNLRADFAAALMLPQARKLLVSGIIEPTPSASSSAFVQFLSAGTAKWGALLRETGAKVE